MKRAPPMRITGLVGDSNAEAARAARQLQKALREGVCPPDREFDRFLPDALRRVSEEYWTPLRVALRASDWFHAQNVRSIVDIGAGVGKFCVAMALLSERVQVTGIEQRGHFVGAARALALRFGVEARVSFVQGGLREVKRRHADAYYLYNPFAENLVAPADALDRKVTLSRARHARDIAAAEVIFSRAPVGTHLLIYNGFGGQVPAGYARIRLDTELPYELALWHKRHLVQALRLEE
jgi:predicted RNA methylase